MRNQTPGLTGIQTPGRLLAAVPRWWGQRGSGCHSSLSISLVPASAYPKVGMGRQQCATAHRKMPVGRLARLLAGVRGCRGVGLAGTPLAALLSCHQKRPSSRGKTGDNAPRSLFSIKEQTGEGRCFTPQR